MCTGAKSGAKNSMEGSPKEKEKEGFYLLHLRHSVWVFLCNKIAK